MLRRALLKLTLLGLTAPLHAKEAPDGQPQATRLLEMNQATRAQLESLRGLGPALVERLLQARQHALFKNWADLRQRVRGIGPGLAQSLSDQGLRVADQAWARAESPPVSAPTQTD